MLLSENFFHPHSLWNFPRSPSVRRFVGWSVVLSIISGKFYCHAPIGELFSSSFFRFSYRFITHPTVSLSPFLNFFLRGPSPLLSNCLNVSLPYVKTIFHPSSLSVSPSLTQPQLQPFFPTLPLAQSPANPLNFNYKIPHSLRNPSSRRSPVKSLAKSQD